MKLCHSMPVAQPIDFLSYTDEEPMLCSPNSYHAERSKDAATHLLEFLQQELRPQSEKILLCKESQAS